MVFSHHKTAEKLNSLYYVKIVSHNKASIRPHNEAGICSYNEAGVSFTVYSIL